MLTLIVFLLFLPLVFWMSGIIQCLLICLFGDTSVKEKGYLEFPKSLIFALGNYPEIDPDRIRNRILHSIIPISGLIVFFLMILVISSPFWLGLTDNWELGTRLVGKTDIEIAMVETFEWKNMDPATKWQVTWLWPMLAILTVYLIFNFILQLLPLPGFSGYRIISPWLPQRFTIHLEKKGYLLVLFIVAVLASTYFFDNHPVSKIFEKLILEDIANDQLKVPISAANRGYKITESFHQHVWAFLMWSLVINQRISSFTHPGKVFVLLINPNSNNKGIYTISHADGQKVIMFESLDDADRYNNLLHQRNFDGLSIEKISRWEVEKFSKSQGYECVLIEEGTQINPPEENAETDFLT